MELGVGGTALHQANVVSADQKTLVDMPLELRERKRREASSTKHGGAYACFATMHHVLTALLALAVCWFGMCPSFPTLLAWWIYSDVYSALLHCVLDNEQSLGVRFLAPVARGFQEHHTFPMETTKGQGLRSLCNDTVRMQQIIAACALLLGQRRAQTVVLVLCKNITCAYGTQVGHYFAHCPGRSRFCRWLQRCGLILSPKHHAIHHRTFDRNFGIVNGASDRILNCVLPRLNYWVALAGLLFLTVADIAVLDYISKSFGFS
jgi:hypothetical protein